MNERDVPSKLQSKEFRFVKVEKRGKRAFEEKWTTVNNYSYDDPQFQSWIKEGGNIGVLGGYGNLLIIDFDSDQAIKDILPNLPQTFTIKTGSGKFHLYYKTEPRKGARLKDSSGMTICDIQGQGTQCLCPPSIHPNGNRYEVYHDAPIAEIEWAEIKAQFSKWWPEEQTSPKKEKREYEPLNKPALIDVLKSYGVNTNRHPTMCPLGHTSKGGHCFSYNDELFNCFHCGAKGDVISFVMQKENCDFKTACQKLGILLKNSLNDANTDILTILEGEIKKKVPIELGIQENSYYFGFKIPSGQTAIVTSEGKILINRSVKLADGSFQGENEIKNFIDYTGYISDISPTMCLKTVKAFYLAKKDGKIISDPKQTYLAIRDKILYYMDFSGRDEIADVLTSWIIATYLYPLFYWFPHILINAPSGSGKSKAFFIVLQLAYRGFDLGASGGVTPAQMFRTIEGCRGTLGLDEFELSAKREDPTQQLIFQIINASPTKDAYVIRCEQDKNKKWISYRFPIFCPKVIANITGLNATSLSRCIALQWLKTSSEKGKQKPYREGDKATFQPLRDELFIFALEHWQQIKYVYSNLSLNLNNREDDNWSPLFAIARYIDSTKGDAINAEKGLLTFLESYQDVEIETGDNTPTFFLLLHELVAEDQKYYTPKELASFPDIADLLVSYKSPAHWIGRILKSYQFKRNRSSGTRKYLLSKDAISKVIKTYNFGTVETSRNDTNDTKGGERHQKTLGTVPFRAVSAVTYECVGDDISDSDLLAFIAERGVSGYPLADFAEKYGDEAVLRLKGEGLICELPAGVLRVV